MQLDFELEPDFRRFVPRLDRNDAWDNTPVLPFPADQDAARQAVIDSMDAGTCPFAWLLQ